LHFAFCIFMALFSEISATVAQSPPSPDTIILAPRADGAGRIIITGKVVEYTGTLLTYETSSGATQSVPGKQVVEIRSRWTAEHAAGDEAWKRREFDDAATHYEAAFAKEPRRWAKRLIQSRLVAARREGERWEQAAELFLNLVRDDPATPYFAVIPLSWTTMSPSPTLETKARAWAADGTSKVAALLGSTYLLSTAARGDSLRQLRELSLDGDARIARLADAQLWRASAVTAAPTQIDAWETAVEKLPEDLSAGPWLVVGRAWGSRNEPERSAAALLRVPILHAEEQPRLAAEALWSAGQMHERLSRPEQAAVLYRELIRDFAETAAAATARDRLKELNL